MNLFEKAEYLIDLIEAAGYEAYEVGGCVRDRIMCRECSDVDIASSAPPRELEKILAAHDIKFVETGLKHGTVTAVYGGDTFEITAFRTDGSYTDSRHPETVTFVSDIRQDLARRDFTVNAAAYNHKRGLVDIFSSRADIENKIIRAVGNPDKRFREDALRILRALRFASVLGFDIEEETKKALFDNKELLKNISAERIFAELSKLLLGRNVFKILCDYKEIIAVVIPEIAPCFDFEQRTRWHLYDVWTHTCKAIEQSPPDLALRVTMLLHDIGKPYSRTTDENGTDHFKGHQKKSAELAEPVLKRLKVPTQLYKRAMFLIPIHDMHIGTDRVSVRRWLSVAGERGLLDLVAVKRADKLAQNPEMTAAELERLDITEEMIHTVISSGDAYRVSDLAVSGDDLISLGYRGKKIGIALDDVLSKVIADELPNTREAIMSYLGFK